jgi:chemotaxis protein MotB
MNAQPRPMEGSGSLQLAAALPGAVHSDAMPVPVGARAGQGGETGLAQAGQDPAGQALASREQRPPARAEAARLQAQQNLARQAREAMLADERETLSKAAAEIRQSIAQDPALADLGRQLMIEQVPEGLRIQVIDAEGQPVFATGQAAPNARGRAVLLRAAAVIARLPNAVEITGHTDAVPFSTATDRTNWELSSERAAAVRRLLVENGVTEPRIRGVAGRADRELLLPAKPLDAANRRVSVLVLLSQPAPQPGTQQGTQQTTQRGGATP